MLPQKIFVGGVPKSLDSEIFMKHFKTYGETADIVLLTGRGFGFVKYKEKTVAEHVLSLNHELGGQKLTVNYTKFPHPNKRFFIRGVDGLKEQDVKSYFEKYAAVHDVYLPQGKNFGFVEFTGQEERQMRELLGTEHQIMGKTVHASEAKQRAKDQPKSGGRGPQGYAPYGASHQPYGVRQNNYGGYAAPPPQSYYQQQPPRGAYGAPRPSQNNSYGQPPPPTARGYSTSYPQQPQQTWPSAVAAYPQPARSYTQATPAQSYSQPAQGYRPEQPSTSYSSAAPAYGSQPTAQGYTSNQNKQYSSGQYASQQNYGRPTTQKGGSEKTYVASTAPPYTPY